MSTDESTASTLTARQRYWLDHLQRCQASGQSMKAYAAEHNLSLASLYSYRQQFRRANQGASSLSPRFVRAEVASPALPCRVHLRNGLVVELGVAGGELASVLRTLTELR